MCARRRLSARRRQSGDGWSSSGHACWVKRSVNALRADAVRAAGSLVFAHDRWAAIRARSVRFLGVSVLNFGAYPVALFASANKPARPSCGTASCGANCFVCPPLRRIGHAVEYRMSRQEFSDSRRSTRRFVKPRHRQSLLCIPDRVLNCMSWLFGLVISIIATTYYVLCIRGYYILALHICTTCFPHLCSDLIQHPTNRLCFTVASIYVCSTYM